MAITAAEVNKLRKSTGAGMMECKKALVETDGDFEAAIDFLRKKGQKLSAKRADRDATEGVVIATVTADGKTGIAVNVSCETDFVAKNEDFIGFAKSVADIALNSGANTVEELLEQEMNGAKLADVITDQIGKIGEKIEVSKFKKVTGDTVVPYIHMGYKVGVLVSMNKADMDAVVEAGKDVAMQIAAMSPVAVDENGVSEDVKERELEIGREQARNEGKPDAMIDKIAQGKLKRFYKDNTLVHQPFVKDSGKTVGQMLKDIHPELAINSFERVALG